jgi:hypothetical protein
MPLLYAGSNLDKAREIFVTIVKHRPRPADHPATVQGMQQWPPRCFAAMKKAPAMGREPGQVMSRVRVLQQNKNSRFYRRFRFVPLVWSSPDEVTVPYPFGRKPCGALPIFVDAIQSNRIGKMTSLRWARDRTRACAILPAPLQYRSRSAFAWRLEVAVLAVAARDQRFEIDR